MKAAFTLLLSQMRCEVIGEAGERGLPGLFACFAFLDITAATSAADSTSYADAFLRGSIKTTTQKHEAKSDQSTWVDAGFLSLRRVKRHRKGGSQRVLSASTTVSVPFDHPQVPARPEVLCFVQDGALLYTRSRFVERIGCSPRIVMEFAGLREMRPSATPSRGRVLLNA